MQKLSSICFLSSMHTPLDKRVFSKEAVTLTQAGYQVTHLAPGDGDSFVKENVNVVTYPAAKGIPGRIFQLKKLYSLAASQDADCYHCNEVDSWFLGVLLKIFRGKVCVFDVHEHYPSTFAQSRFPLWLQPLVAFLIRTIFRFLIPFTDRIVLAKKSVSSDFRCPSNKKVLVRNFTLLKTMSDRKEGNTPQGGKRGALRVIHLGLIGRLRGWPQMLEGVAQCQQNVKLHIVGEFNDPSFPDFKKKVAELGLRERVHYEEWLPFDEAFQRILASDVGLVLFQPGVQNHVFALPHKMFDYMLGGLVVIAPGFAEEVAPIIKEADCGFLVAPDNPAELAYTLDHIAQNAEEMRRMGRNGRNAVIERYNWENEAKRLITMYQEILE